MSQRATRSSMRKIAILPSILAADFANLGQETLAAMNGGADLVHLDIMDGHFVPNISYGPDVVRALRPLITQPFDVHLMISPADPYLESFAKAGGDIITVHAEAGPHLHRSLQAIRALGKRAGVALNPGTSETAIAHVLDLADLVLVMTVNPGFGGQKFIAPMCEKIRRVRDMCAGRDIDIEVDGGITAATVGQAAAAGANYFVAGSAVFNSKPDTYAANIAAIRTAAESARGMIV